MELNLPFYPPPIFSDDRILEGLSDEFAEPKSPLRIREHLPLSELDVSFIGPHLNPEITFHPLPDLAVPPPPRNLQVVNNFSNLAYLWWDAPSSDGGSPITGYKVEWSTDGGTNWEVLVDDTERTVRNYSFISSRLTPGATFHFRVRALNADGESAPSNVASITASSPSGPGIPTNVRVAETSSGAAQVSWDAPTDLPDGQSAWLYYLYKSDDNGDFWSQLPPIHAPTLSYTDNSVSRGRTYGYRVRAAYGVNLDLSVASDFSEPAYIKLSTPPDEVSSLTVTSVSASIIDLSWTAPTNDGGSPITGYTVDIRTVTPQAYVRFDETTSTSYRVTGLNHSTQYRIVVRARNNRGSGISTSITATTTAATSPDAPTGVTATATGRTTIEVSWTLPVETGGSPISAGQIGVSRNGTTDDGFIGVSPGALSATDKGLQPNTIYYYRIRLQNSEGVSPWSDYVSATTDAVSAPGAPTGLTAAASGLNSHVLTWTAPADDGGAAITSYVVEESNTGTGTWSVLIPANRGNAVPRFSKPVSPGTITYYRVKAHNSVGTGPPSNAVRARAKVVTAPAAPTGLTATADGPSVIHLRWTAPSNTGNAAITGYRIESFWLGGGFWIDVTRNTQSTATTYMHTGLTANTKLYYRVSAINTAGTGGASSSVSATTTAATAPAAPTELTATADGQTAINLRWTAPINTGGAAIKGYQIESSPTGTGDTWTNLVDNTESTTTTYAHTGLSAGTTRHYRVSAINSVDSSPPSNVAMATTAAVITAPGAPTSLTATADGQTIINLSWTAPESTGGAAIEGYQIEQSPNGMDSWTDVEDDTESTATTYAHTGLAAGTTRHYRVRAINSVDTSPPSNVAMATTAAVITAPGAPTSLTATASGQTTINLSWTAPTSTGGVDITGYKIEVSTDGGSTFTQLVESHPTPPYAHTSLTAAVTRHYRVRAINSATLSGAWSNVATATTADAATPTAPSAPTSLTATASGQTTINLSWTAPSSNGGGRITGYQIEVSTDGGTTFGSLVARHPTTSYSHTGLTAGVTRHYRVSAINSAGAGMPSNVANATTASDDRDGDDDDGGGEDDATAPALTFTVASASVDEAAGTYPISVTLSASSSTETTLSYTLSGTATQGSDYTIQSSVTLNGTSAQIPIVIVDDQDEEPDETIIVTLVSSTAYTLGRITAFTLTITDNDAVTLSFAQTLGDQSYYVGLAIDDLTLPAARQGTQPYSYSLTPELPKGLIFDAATRILSGTPTEATAAKTYTYTAIDASANSATLSFTIAVVQAEALTLTETVDDQRVPVQRLLKDLVFPVATGGIAPYSYTLTPELPSGLMFDAATRMLSGTPSEVAAAQMYTYSVQDQAGTRTEQNFSLEVYQLSFAETVPNQTYSRAQPIDPLTLPEVTGVAPITYTLTLLDLPLGLRYDGLARTISGTPTEVTPPVSLTYKATDANGASDSLMFTIEVVSPVQSEDEAGLPEAFQVYPNYPNPFYRSTHLVFDLPWPAQVQVEVLDVIGRRMTAPREVHLSAGWRHELALSDLGLPSGPYLYQIKAMSLDDNSSSVYIGHFVSVH